MIKRFLSLLLMIVFSSMQCAMADTVLYGNASQYGKGKVLKAFLQSEISTTDAVKGDPIVVILSENWVENGKTIAEAGSVINGVISSANAAGGWSKNGSLQIDFQSMETPDGQIYGLTAEKIDIQVEKEKKSWIKTAAKVGGTILAVAAVGALIGVASDGDGYKTTTTHTSTGTVTRTTRDKDYGHDSATGAIIGAGIGAVIAAGVAATQKGNNITIPANTNFEIVLLDNITVKSY